MRYFYFPKTDEVLGVNTQVKSLVRRYSRGEASGKGHS